MSLLFSSSGWRLLYTQWWWIESEAETAASPAVLNTRTSAVLPVFVPFFCWFHLLAYCGWLCACLSACLSVYLSISYVWLEWRTVIACKCEFNFVFKWNERANTFVSMHIQILFVVVTSFKPKWNEKESNERKTISKIVIILSLKWQRNRKKIGVKRMKETKFYVVWNN